MQAVADALIASGVAELLERRTDESTLSEATPVRSQHIDQKSIGDAMVDRYTEWADWTDQADEWADRRPRQGAGTDSAEGSLHVAKVRVAGSNPVVRSI